MSDRPRCDTCRWWSEDDDPKPVPMGCCVVLLNDPKARNFYTLPQHVCPEHQPQEPT
jgi:hypothetical protein